MDLNALVELLFGLMGGLGIFLLGMKNMSDGMQAVAGASLRRLIGFVTNNRFLATIVGVEKRTAVTTDVVLNSQGSTVETPQLAAGQLDQHEFNVGGGEARLRCAPGGGQSYQAGRDTLAGISRMLMREARRDTYDIP